MPLDLYLAFVVTAFLVILVPGPVVSLVIANALRHGSLYALMGLAGTQSGTALLLLAVGLGLSVLIGVMAEWFDWIRWVGAAYLIWLGYKRLTDRSHLDGAEAEKRRPFGKVFLQGFLVSLSNPKSMAFLAVFLPQFIDPDSAPGPQMAILCATFWVIAFIGDGFYAIAAGSARRWLSRPGRLQWVNRITGSVLIAGGAWLALQRR
jgi:threonine/homoserine/homoserine lactone efflux protein